ncbi:MAG: hypothetical protein LBD11_02780 [Candidatus Peribacteria bacterium]|jgi:hypothetical protein|nr:hypothetical protein [Candidatus Peribacteria bacterium]
MKTKLINFLEFVVIESLVLYKQLFLIPGQVKRMKKFSWRLEKLMGWKIAPDTISFDLETNFNKNYRDEEDVDPEGCRIKAWRDEIKEKFAELEKKGIGKISVSKLDVFNDNLISFEIEAKKWEEVLPSLVYLAGRMPLWIRAIVNFPMNTRLPLGDVSSVEGNTVSFTVPEGYVEGKLQDVCDFQNFVSKITDGYCSINDGIVVIL